MKVKVLFIFTFNSERIKNQYIGLHHDEKKRNTVSGLLPEPAPIEEAFERVLFHNANTINPISAVVKRFSAKNVSEKLKSG